MRKYLTVFTVSLQNEFIYRLNFVLWRVRNVLRLLMTYFLWKGIYVGTHNAFGYSQGQMLTYVFMVLVVQSLVLSAPSSDNIGGEIGNGDLSNYLVKPLGYLKYWFTRDVASKLLNLAFASVEVTILWFFLRPEIVFPLGLGSWIGFLVASLLAVTIYYFLNVSSRFIAFWTPENTWGFSFLVIIFIEILGGGIFPLNILPGPIYSFLQITPFPYLVYFPIAMFSGKIYGWEMLRVLTQTVAWFVVMLWLTKLLWRRGMMVYQASGR